MAAINKIWQQRLQASQQRIALKRFGKQKSSYKFWAITFLLLLWFLFPEYPKRFIYPILFGKPYTQKLEISQQDFFEDVETKPLKFSRHGKNYILQPRTKYAVTAKVGFVDHYDTWFNKAFRGFSQADYIDLVPQDLLLLIGKMASPEVFKMFQFEHEERLGRVLCKGVKYRRSFASAFSSESEARKSAQNAAACHPFIKNEEYNNYHPIPANERINRALSMLVKGDVVHLEGYLVDVPQMRLKTGTRKQQSHTNMLVNGVQPGMCFILYTTKIIVNNHIYE